VAAAAERAGAVFRARSVAGLGCVKWQRRVEMTRQRGCQTGRSGWDDARDRKEELAAFAQVALYPDTAVVGEYNLLRDRKAEPETFAPRFPVGLPVLVENMGKVIGGNPRTGVAHTHFDVTFGTRRFDVNFAPGWSELDGVAEEVGEYLEDAIAIAANLAAGTLLSRLEPYLLLLCKRKE
jgi:hypothetical protein